MSAPNTRKESAFVTNDFGQRRPMSAESNASLIDSWVEALAADPSPFNARGLADALVATAATPARRRRALRLRGRLVQS